MSIVKETSAQPQGKKRRKPELTKALFIYARAHRPFAVQCRFHGVTMLAKATEAIELITRQMEKDQPA